MQSIAEILARKSNPPAPPQPTFDFYRNAEARSPSNTVTLADLIDGIRDDSFAELVGKVRALVAAGDKKAADMLKKTLAAVTVSGSVTTGGRAKAAESGRFAHSGLLQIDLDAKDNPEWTVAAMVELLRNDPHVQAGFITPSGMGVKGLARISANVETHRASFLTAEAYFAKLGLRIDKSCKDAVRLCFVSHDPDAWIRSTPAAEFEPLEEVESLELRVESEEEESDAREPGPPMYHVAEDGGIRIRGNALPEITLETIRQMLACIPYPGYDEWLKITNAVWTAVGEAGTPILQAWAPEKKPGDYAEKFAHRLSDVTIGTLIMRAKEHGWAPAAPVSSVAPRSPKPEIKDQKPESAGKAKDKNAIPATVFPVPAGDIGHDLACRHIFAVIGPTNRLFIRGTTVQEIGRASDDGEQSLLTVLPKRFASEIETFGARVMRRELREDGIARWRSTVFPLSSADIALSSTAAREFLPPIRQLVSAPVLVSDGDNGTQVLGKGYHSHAGGTFVTGGGMPPVVSLDEAKAMLLEILEDFDFPEGGDASRAIASLISPAMKIGGWIEDDFPLDIAEADQSQAGKSHRHKLICAIYRESPSAITQSVGGVGSLDERVSTALIKGRPFIAFDNFRGRMDSQILETAIRGLGKVSARALRIETDIDSTPFLWQLSTNGAELTRDLANRSVITRIRKRPEAHMFRVYPEGNNLAHIKANQPRFVGAVHAIIREWVAQGRLMTGEARHDFRTWCRCMDWIVQNIFEFPPLLDGHREEQMRTANPKLQWLRDVTHAVITDGHDGSALTASDLAEVAEEHDLPLPGRRDSTEALEVRVGKLLGRLFKEAGDTTLIVDGRRFTRQMEHEYDPIRKEHRDRKTYLIDHIADSNQCSEHENEAELF